MALREAPPNGGPESKRGRLSGYQRDQDRPDHHRPPIAPIHVMTESATSVTAVNTIIIMLSNRAITISLVASLRHEEDQR